MEYICHWEKLWLDSQGTTLQRFGLVKEFKQAILGQIKGGAAGSPHSSET